MILQKNHYLSKIEIFCNIINVMCFYVQRILTLMYVVARWLLGCLHTLDMNELFKG